MPLFRRILQITPFFAGPIFGVIPTDPIHGQIYLYNMVVLGILFAAWSGTLSILSSFVFLPGLAGGMWKSKPKALAILGLLLVLIFFVVASLTLTRHSVTERIFYLVLTLLAGGAFHQRAATSSPGDQALLTGFVYAFGLALLSIWLGMVNDGFDWIIVVPAVALAALCTFHEVARIVESAGRVYFRTEDQNTPGKKKKKPSASDSVPHPRRYARVYTAMLLLGPVALALLTSLEILPPQFLLPLIAVPIMTSNFQGIHLAKHSGSFPVELERKSTNFSILLLILVIVAGLT